jgi:hypothetical protein
VNPTPCGEWEPDLSDPLDAGQPPRCVTCGLGEQEHEVAPGLRRLAITDDRPFRAEVLRGPQGAEWLRGQLDPVNDREPARRCGRCGYLISSRGHQTACG